MTDFTDDKPIEQINDVVDEYLLIIWVFSTDSDDKSCLTMKNTTLLLK